MTGIQAPDSFGSPKQVRQIWAADSANLRSGGVGAMQPVTDGWVWDTASSTFKRFWPQPPVISSIAFSPGSDWRKLVITVTADGATTFEHIAGVGAAGSILPNTTNTFEFDWFDYWTVLAPGATMTYIVHASNGTGTTGQSAYVVLSTPPAPTNLHTVSVAYNTCTVAWDPVPGATSYRILNTLNGNSLVTTTTALSAVIGLNPATTYSFVVQAVCTPALAGAPSYTGPTSAAVRFTSPVGPSGPAPGVYIIRTATNATYQWGESGGSAPGWRSTADDLYHGDAGSADTRGQQAGFFFYGTNLTSVFPDGLGDRTVTKFEVLITRKAIGGISGNTIARWNLHNYLSRPSGAPALYSPYDIGGLAWGETAWCQLPVSWGTVLINGGRHGIAWGKVAARFMVAESAIGAGTPNGSIRITVA